MFRWYLDELEVINCISTKWVPIVIVSIVIVIVPIVIVIVSIVIVIVSIVIVIVPIVPFCQIAQTFHQIFSSTPFKILSSPVHWILPFHILPNKNHLFKNYFGKKSKVHLDANLLNVWSHMRFKMLQTW